MSQGLLEAMKFDASQVLVYLFFDQDAIFGSKWERENCMKISDGYRVPKKTMKIQKVSQQEKSTNILSNMGKFSPVPDPTRPLSRSSNLGASSGISGGLASSNEEILCSVFQPEKNYNLYHHLYPVIYIRIHIHISLIFFV